MQYLELKIPPAVLVLFYAAMMSGLAKIDDWAFVSIPASEWIATMLAISGVAVIFIAAHSFLLVKTTANPMTPQLTMTLVRNGIYAISRNPMYVGFVFLLLAWGVYLQNMLALLWMPTFMVYMNRFQILPEERVLESKFGEDYKCYLRSVRRWL
mgnify:CR=1 FL=1